MNWSQSPIPSQFELLQQLLKTFWSFGIYRMYMDRILNELMWNKREKWVILRRLGCNGVCMNTGILVIWRFDVLCSFALNIVLFTESLSFRHVDNAIIYSTGYLFSFQILSLPILFSFILIHFLYSIEYSMISVPFSKTTSFQWNRYLFIFLISMIFSIEINPSPSFQRPISQMVNWPPILEFPNSSRFREFFEKTIHWFFV